MSFTNSEVCALWAKQLRASAQSANGNLWFDGPVLYSYRTPIGRLLDGHVLLSSIGYSMTTKGKHLNPAHRATGYRAFSVPQISPAPDFASLHASNLSDYVARIEAERKRLTRARTFKSEDFLNRLIVKRDAYTQAFLLEQAA